MRIQKVSLVGFAYRLLMGGSSKEIAELIFKASYLFLPHIWSIIMSVILHVSGGMDDKDKDSDNKGQITGP